MNKQKLKRQQNTNMKLTQHSFFLENWATEQSQGKQIIEYACIYIAKNKTKNHIYAPLQRRSALVVVG